MPKRPRGGERAEAAEAPTEKVDFFAEIAASRAKAARASDGEADAAASATAADAHAPGAAPGARAVYDKEAVISALESFEPDPPLDWVERLDVSSAAPLDIADADDDLEREKQFYKQAFAAVITARAELERRGVPHLRPDDYFAEMLKSDAHMLRVRGKLLSEKERLEAVEARKRAQETRKFAKQVQAEKEQSRIKEKKEQADAVTEWRKQRARGGGSAVDSGKGLDMVLEGTGKGAVAASRGRTTERGRPAAAAAAARSVSRKRQHKDSKFGFGGKKRAQKSNDSKSASDVSGFSMRKNRELPAGMTMRKGGAKRTAAGKGGARMGKSARSRSRG